MKPELTVRPSTIDPVECVTSAILTIKVLKWEADRLIEVRGSKYWVNP